MEQVLTPLCATTTNVGACADGLKKIYKNANYYFKDYADFH